jgi:hypothetical protein
MYIRKEQWEAAEAGCKRVLKLDKCHVKARFCLSKALLHLGKASQALDIIDDLLASNASDRTFKLTKQEAERLLREENGHYDFMSMHQEQTSSGLCKFHADFASNAVAFGVDVLKCDGNVIEDVLQPIALLPTHLFVHQKHLLLFLLLQKMICNFNLIHTVKWWKAAQLLLS